MRKKLPMFRDNKYHNYMNVHFTQFCNSGYNWFNEKDANERHRGYESLRQVAPVERVRVTGGHCVLFYNKKTKNSTIH